MISSQASHWPPTFEVASLAQSGRVPDQTCSELDAFRIGGIQDWTRYGSDWTHRALKTRRCSRLDSESLKNKEVFRIGLEELKKPGGVPHQTRTALIINRCFGLDKP